MATADTAIVEKIRKLLALSQSPNEFEATLAASKAQALLTAHALTLDDVAEEEFINYDVLLHGEQWRQWLLAMLVALNDCVVLVTPDARVARVVGPPAVVAGIQTFYESLADIVPALAQTAWDAHVQEYTDPFYGVYPSLLEPGADVEWRQSFMFGAIARLEQRLQDAKAEAVSEADHSADGLYVSGAALVRLDQQLVKVKAHVDAHYDAPKQVAPLPTLISPDAVQRGLHAGNVLPLTAQRRVRGK